MGKSKAFSLFSLAFISGISFSSFWYPHGIDDFYFFLLIIASLTVVFSFHKEKAAVIAGFFIMFIALGAYMTEIRLENVKDVHERNFHGTAKVVKEPEVKNNYQNITVRSDEVGRFLIRTGVFPEYSYGDVLDVRCKLKVPLNQDNSSFDYRMYLAKEGIFLVCPKAEIKKIGNINRNNIYAGMIRIKNNVNEKILSQFPSPQSGLLSGLIVGGDDMISKEYQEYFSKTGMTHIVAVSGYNVTIVAEYLMMIGIFMGLWRRQAFWFAVIGIVLFVVMVGLPSSAVRAGVMGILLIWAVKKGRLANSQNAVLLAADIMLLANPLLLRWDISFQLSFLATLGIIYIYPLFENYFVKKQDSFGLTDILILTVSAQIFVLPVIFMNFQKLSLISPVANLLVLPVIPLTMLLGFLSVLCGFLFPVLAPIVSWLAFLPLKYETIAIKYLAGLKYSSVGIKTFPWWAAVAWYIILITAIRLLRYKHTNVDNA